LIHFPDSPQRHLELRKGTPMARVYTPAMRVVVVVALLAGTVALLHVTVRTARAVGALVTGSCGDYGEAHDFRSLPEAERNALAKCKGEGCRVVATLRRGCAALAVDYANAFGGHGWKRGAAWGRCALL
jgi:hypothetical protein